MNKVTEWGLYAATTAVFVIALVNTAFADNINQNQSGAGNTQIIGNGNNSPGANFGTAAGNITVSPNISVKPEIKNSVNTTDFNLNDVDQSQKQKQSQSQGQSLSNKNDNSNDGNNQHTDVSFRDRLQAPGIMAPGLTSSGIDTCLGSASAGLSVAGFGGTGGATMTDENCKLLKNSERAAKWGFKANALFQMCKDPVFRAGQLLEETKCPQDTPGSVAYEGPKATQDILASMSASEDDAQAAYPSAHRGIYR